MILLLLSYECSNTVYCGHQLLRRVAPSATRLTSRSPLLVPKPRPKMLHLDWRQLHATLRTWQLYFETGPPSWVSAPHACKHVVSGKAHPSSHLGVSSFHLHLLSIIDDQPCDTARRAMLVTHCRYTETPHSGTMHLPESRPTTLLPEGLSNVAV